MDAKVVPFRPARKPATGSVAGDLESDDPQGCDGILFVCSAINLSTGAFRRLEAICTEATRQAHLLIRLEDSGASLFDALDALHRAGSRRLRVQPIGLPFPESLLAWLPGVIAEWQSWDENADATVLLGPEPSRAADGAALMLRRVLALPGRSLESTRPSLGKPGWEMPPDFDFHLLVCTGPRCHLRDAPSLTHMLKAECAEAGIANRCLTTSTGCIYPCNKGPVVAVYPMGAWFRIPDRRAARRLVREVLCDGRALPEFHFHTARLAHPSPKEILT